MSEEQYWQYDPFSKLVSQFPNEEVAIYYAENDSSIIVFAASLYDIKDYPYKDGNKIVLGPYVFFEDNAVTVNGEIFEKYPRQEGTKTILGPDIIVEDNEITFSTDVILEGRFVTINGKPYGKYPRQEGNKAILGPNVFREGHIVTVDGQTFYQTCNAPVILNRSKCIMPIDHHSNQHEDKNGNVRYA